MSMSSHDKLHSNATPHVWPSLLAATLVLECVTVGVGACIGHSFCLLSSYLVA